MIVAGSANPLLLASAGGYNLTNSLRFRQSASAYLSRTPSVEGSRRIWTFSTWVKRGALGSTFQSLFSASNSSTVQFFFGFGNDQLQILNWASVTQMQLNTTAVYRDPSAWYHLVLAMDTTQATSTNRVKLYVNGVEITSFSTSSYPAQNLDIAVNALVPHAIGREEYSDNQWFDGYMAETHYVQGQQLTPSSFGQFSPATGVWQPKKYAGTYGTNGFYLPFTDNSALTTSSNVGLGKDFSGNGNYWTTNNISITSGATYDSMTDVPTLTSATASNFATLNPLKVASASSTITNGNLTGTAYGSGTLGLQNLNSTFQLPTSGKYYYEVTVTTLSSMAVGIFSDVGDRLAIYKGSTGEIIYNGSSTTSVATFAANDVIALAIDMDSPSVAFYKNNSLITTLTSATYIASGFCGFSQAAGSGSCVGEINFGQRPFTYTPPTGFVALNTFNLPTPTIGATASTQANKYFDVSLYTGNGSTQSVTNSGSMQPDMVWMKSRSNAYNNLLHDSSRGVTQLLIPNGTDAQETVTDGITSFNSNGFSLGANGSYNQSTRTYVGWQWKVNGGTTSSNTSGSITSTVQVGASQGISIVTYTGNGSTGTVGHGLGVAPKMIIVKCRGAASQWGVYHASVDATPQNYALILNATSAKELNSLYWNNTAPTSTVFSLGGSSAGNTSGQTQVAYCFSEIAGYSKFGSYTGNGSTDGTFVYTGFRPAFIMVKRTDSTGFWAMLDDARGPYNVVDEALYANSANAESTAQATDFTSNGFKLRTTDSDVNASGTYIYMAFAEFPTKFSLAR